ncbi:PREDICTED: zinc finger protein 316-like [Gekko japonicus]|uniref:Zinc finger protein 316-like n=1 Tax=Gekko japonicus TaxID=146911 RepID=A0ABM1JPD8_GEKJA|nr:PREDICTED: zinc finger protein 316-like [Gekko japonicus]
MAYLEADKEPWVAWCKKGSSFVLQGLVTFEDVAIYFSLEEWAMLTAWQRDLYREVMADNFELVASLEPQLLPTPGLICKVEQGEEPSAVDHPGQGGEDARGTPLSAAQSPSVQDPAIKDEFSGSWSPPGCPESGPWGADVGSLPACPSWSESKPPGVGGALQGPWEQAEGRGSPEPAEWQICECGRSFGDGASLREHQALHEKEKGPFACTACGKLFRYRLNLLTHKKHRGKQPHACAQCGGQFCLKGDLLRHRASHVAEGLHPCRVCGLLFGRKRHLLAHELEHSQETSLRRSPTRGMAFGSEWAALQCGIRGRVLVMMPPRATLADPRETHAPRRPCALGPCRLEKTQGTRWLGIHARQHRAALSRRPSGWNSAPSAKGARGPHASECGETQLAKKSCGMCRTRWLGIHARQHRAALSRRPSGWNSAPSAKEDEAIPTGTGLITC